MKCLRNIQIIALFISIYIVNVRSQSESGQLTDASETQNSSIVNPGNPEANALSDTPSDTKINIEPAKPQRKPQPRGRKVKAKRRPRNRRPNGAKSRRINGNGKGAIAKNTEAKAEKIVSESIAAPVEEIVKVSAVAAVQDKRSIVVAKKQITAAVVETQPSPVADEPKAAAVVKSKPVKEKKKEPKAAVDFGFDQDTFLWGETTTVATDMNEPPPDFSVARKPRKKIMPKVDTENSKAYDGTPCNETFKSHPTDKTKYIVIYLDGGFDALDCPPNLGTGLVWRQDLCACGEELVAQDPNDMCAMMGFNPHLENRHKYVRKHHGVNAVKDCPASLVWSQENCLCIFDSTVKDRPIENSVTFVCKTILQMSFEGNLKNTAEGYHVQPVDLRRRGKIPRIRYRKIQGSTGKAAMIVSQPLEFLAFRGNDFQRQVTYSLNFKISPRHQTKNVTMVLITDECKAGNQNKVSNASIRLAFQPNTGVFQLVFRTIKAEVNELIKGALPDSIGWYKVVIYFEDNALTMEVNGKQVFNQKHIPGKIPQNKCPLYIAGRGRGFDRTEDFYGYLDNVVLVKDCKFHEANIKFL